MTIEIVALVCALIFAMFSLSAVLIFTVIRERDATAPEPVGLSRRLGNYDLERAFECRQSGENWMAFLLQH